jgi:preprotein translocase subunit SecE
MENSTKEFHIEEGHQKGTMEDQMSYNRKTLQELNDIIFNSSNQVCNRLIIVHPLNNVHIFMSYICREEYLMWRQ